MRRSTAAYSGAYTEILKVFGGLEDAKNKGLSTRHFFWLRLLFSTEQRALSPFFCACLPIWWVKEPLSP